jgi:methylenetetrahydrofolate reductase (NADPH)
VTRAPASLLENYSIEMTAKDVPQLEAAAAFIPQGTKVPVTFLPGEGFPARVPLRPPVPIPHISARRIASQAELEAFLAALQRDAAIDHAFVVAGDLPQPLGPYEDALAIIRTGLLAKYGVKRVGISGYPEGHRDIGDEKLWQAKRDKMAALRDKGHDFAVVTQFSFDADPVLRWLEDERAQGVDGLVRIGIPGPASVKTLLRFAARCGVGASTKVMAKYGLSMTRLLSTTGPDRLIEDFALRLDPVRHGDVLFHLYPFGGLKATAAWAKAFQAR